MNAWVSFFFLENSYILKIYSCVYVVPNWFSVYSIDLNMRSLIFLHAMLMANVNVSKIMHIIFLGFFYGLVLLFVTTIEVNLWTKVSGGSL
jgi:hypothetical protein